MGRKKIKIIYPDGHISMENVVSDTYCQAIKHLGADRVRALNIMRNSINIVSTEAEIKASTGKPESICDRYRDPRTGLYICRQFSTKDKYKILTELNEELRGSLQIFHINPFDKYIWVVAEAYETERIYANIDTKAMGELCRIFYDALYEVYDEEEQSYLDYNVIEACIDEYVVNGPHHCQDFGVISLQRYSLNVIDDDIVMIDEDFEVKPGAKVYEAYHRINMGCDCAEVRLPLGFLTKKIELGYPVEWAEHILR